MVVFAKWQERLVASDAIPNRILYKRKSTESGERQIGSHAQQNEAADREWGAIDPAWARHDNYTGTTFDRPQLQDMLSFCRARPWPRNDPGRIEMYDPSCFGRILEDEGRPDVAAYQQLHAELTKLGWMPQFMTVKTSGDSLSDIILLVLHAHMAASYSVALSMNVKRGMIKRAFKGWWTGGPAPWGTLRKDVAADRVLKEGERSSASANTILVPHDTEVAQWTKAARLIVGGMSLDRVSQIRYNGDGVAGKRRGRMTHSTIRKLLTNTALIGRISFRGVADKHGNRPIMAVQAKWPPTVDADLFDQVLRRLAVRRVAGAPRRRRRTELFPLTLICAHCGLEYNRCKLKAEQGGKRQCAHSKPKNRRGDISHERFVHAGCKVRYIDAEEIEAKVKDLIVRERSSAEFEAEIRRFLLEKEKFSQSSANSVAEAEKHSRDRQSAYERGAKLMAGVMAETGASVRSDDALMEQLAQLRRKVAIAEDNLKVARKHAESGVRAFEKLVAPIHETRNIGSAWHRLGGAERRAIFDHWVIAVYITAEPIKGMRRANRKTAVVALPTDPYSRRVFELPSGYRATLTKAASSAAETDGSVSAPSLASIAASAAGPPSVPSAHAACDRTNGSSSSSAAVRTGTAAGSPELPNATATLRKNPRRLVRLIGDPAENALQSSTDMVIQSSGDDSVNCGLDANEPEVAGSENLRLYGHTLWEMCRYNRLMVDLDTGRRSVGRRERSNAASNHSSRQDLAP